ncbi:MAG: beta-N-acetylhexosaminidase [Alphaproteobacteria bacterium]|nr:beta-N-acetylhexosaminidase [Alphaproteobacteria bacterium]
MLSINAASPVIFGCSGPTLTLEERIFFEKNQPLGFILFQRNIENKAQLKALIEDLKSTVSHFNVPILIDQEGGRVVRLKSPEWFEAPSSAVLAEGDLKTAKKKVYECYTRMAQDLIEVGITVDCAPVLDLRIKGADPIMGDRTFSSDPEIVAELGKVAIQALLEGGITPIMKHIPGHGAATCDSHEELPVISLSLKQLLPHFEPFKANCLCPAAMTAHIIYSAIDRFNTATQSSIVIKEIIRREIGFHGFLISDDLGMKALSGPFSLRAHSSLQAGCDAVLHCSGKMDEMIDVMKGVAPFSIVLKDKAS